MGKALLKEKNLKQLKGILVIQNLAINKLQKNLAIKKLQSFVITPQVGTQLHQQVADYIQLIKQGTASVDLGNSLVIVGKTLAEELKVLFLVFILHFNNFNIIIFIHSKITFFKCYKIHITLNFKNYLIPLLQADLIVCQL